jgi:hypothetical protein
MRRRRDLRSGYRARDAILALTLVNYLVAALGIPLPCRGCQLNSSAPFPCQDHPCGCSTSEECWKGDCCCFTLEEKIAWAESEGIEPPDHARVLVAARKSGGAKRANSRTCCSEPAAPECEGRQPEPRSRLVLGIFAQRCHGGDRLAGLSQIDLTCLSKPAADVLSGPAHVGSLELAESDLVSCTTAPSAPPPRCS